LQHALQQVDCRLVEMFGNGEQPGYAADTTNVHQYINIHTHMLALSALHTIILDRHLNKYSYIQKPSGHIFH